MVFAIEYSFLAQPFITKRNLYQFVNVAGEKIWFSETRLITIHSWQPMTVCPGSLNCFHSCQLLRFVTISDSTLRYYDRGFEITLSVPFAITLRCGYATYGGTISVMHSALFLRVESVPAPVHFHYWSHCLESHLTCRHIELVMKRIVALSAPTF